MRVLIQRVNKAAVVIKDKVYSEIKNGLLIFIGIEESDNEEDISWLVNKIANLRIFNDQNDIPNLSAQDVNAEYMVVSQFTLQASVKKGNRPSYIKAAKPDIAIPLYEKFVKSIELVLAKKVQTGVFGADMKVSLINDGTVTIIMDSKNKE